MGEILGLPEWVAATLFVVVVLAILLGFGFWMLRRAHRRVASRRANPTETEFLTMMASDCSPEAARFVWAQALPYVEPLLTPHPDDHLVKDLCIDNDDVGLDWVRDWTERSGILESDLPDWPKDWPPTVRNYARWLDFGHQ